jgi:hypothetical protein
MKVMLLTAGTALAFNVATIPFAQTPGTPVPSYECVPTASKQEGDPPNMGGAACASVWPRGTGGFDGPPAHDPRAGADHHHGPP